MSNMQDRSMVYVLVATLHFHRKEFIPLEAGECTETFQTKNCEVLVKIFDEVVSLFNYKPTIYQVNGAVAAYLSEQKSTHEMIAAI